MTTDTIIPKELVSFSLLADPQPKGSMSPMPIRKGGSEIVACRCIEANKKAVPFMKLIAHEAMASFRGQKERTTEAKYCEWRAIELINRPLILSVRVERIRLASHFRADGKTLTKLAPLYPDTKPDMGKVIRAVEDALEGVLFTNDARIVSHQITKVWGEAPRTTVTIGVLPKTARDAADWDSISLFEEVW